MPKQAKQSRSTKTAVAVQSMGDTVICDSVVPEFARRVRGNSAKWVVYWKQEGRRKKTTLGDWDTIAIDRARALARDMVSVENVLDVQPTTAPSIAAFSEVFLEDCAGRWKRPARQGENRADDVLRLATNTLSVPPVNAKQVLAEHRSNHPATLLYHKTDTHWNELGAAFGMHAAFASLEGEIDLPNSETTVSPKSGDLARMLGQQYSISETIPTLEHKTKWRCFDSQNVALTIETIDPVMPERFSCKSTAKNDKKNRRFHRFIWSVCDPILASSFQEIEFIWQDLVNPYQAQSLGADIVIQIIVEWVYLPR